MAAKHVKEEEDIPADSAVSMETIMIEEEMAMKGLNLWDNIEADIADLTTFNLLKDQYNNRIREIESSSSKTDTEQLSEGKLKE